MVQSMSRVARCIDNGPMEGFWGILKRERYYGKRFTDKETLIKMIEDYIDYSYGKTHTLLTSCIKTASSSLYWQEKFIFFQLST